MGVSKAMLEKATPILEEAFDHFLIIALDEDVEPHRPILLAHGDIHYCLRLLEIARKNIEELVKSQE